jgi:CBS domain-containing protein
MNLEILCARDLMTKKIFQAERHETLRTAVSRMNEHGIHGLLIAPDTPRRGYAILTGKDCIQVLSDNGEEALEELCVEDAMTQPAVTVPDDLCIADCIRLMRLAGVRTVPVLDNRELVGILSFTDILRAIDGPLDPD